MEVWLGLTGVRVAAGVVDGVGELVFDGLGGLVLDFAGDGGLGCVRGALALFVGEAGRHVFQDLLLVIERVLGLSVAVLYCFMLR